MKERWTKRIIRRWEQEKYKFFRKTGIKEEERIKLEYEDIEERDRRMYKEKR